MQTLLHPASHPGSQRIAESLHSSHFQLRLRRPAAIPGSPLSSLFTLQQLHSASAAAHLFPTAVSRVSIVLPFTVPPALLHGLPSNGSMVPEHLGLCRFAPGHTHRGVPITTQPSHSTPIAERRPKPRHTTLIRASCLRLSFLPVCLVSHSTLQPAPRPTQ
jgi:hypothetical protein